MNEQLALSTPTESLCALIVSDRLHGVDVQLVIDAIIDAAAANNGIVDANLVRPHIHHSVFPKVIGAVYNVLIRKGALVPTGDWSISNDTAGRNSGRPVRRYRLELP